MLRLVLLLVAAPTIAFGGESSCKCTGSSASPCSMRNNTCRTSTQCVFYAILDEGEWTSTYYCARPEDTERCGQVKSDWTMQCCEGDMCNAKFTPPARPTSPNDNQPEVPGADGGTDVVIFVVAGVSVFVMVLLTLVILVIFLKYYRRTHQYDLERQREEGGAAAAVSHGRGHRSGVATRASAHHSDSDAQAYCQCCREQSLSQNAGGRESKRKARHERRVRSHSEPPRRHSYLQPANNHHINNNRQQKYMTANNKMAYSVRGEFSRPPFAARVDPESQSPMPSTRHHLRVGVNDQSSSGSDSTSSWLSTDSQKPITKKGGNSPV